MVPIIRASRRVCRRVDGAFEPWLRELTAALLAVYPLPAELEAQSADGLPPPRVSIADADAKTLAACEDPLKNDPQYHTATVSCNHRITAEDWYQDVRHFELDFDEAIRYHLVGRVVSDVAHTAKL